MTKQNSVSFEREAPDGDIGTDGRCSLSSFAVVARGWTTEGALRFDLPVALGHLILRLFDGGIGKGSHELGLGRREGLILEDADLGAMQGYTLLGNKEKFTSQEL